MVNGNDVIDYVMNTPSNTNRNVLKPMVEEIVGTKVVANPEMTGDEDNLTGLQVDKTKYVIPNNIYIVNFTRTTYDSISGGWILTADHTNYEFVAAARAGKTVYGIVNFTEGMFNKANVYILSWYSEGMAMVNFKFTSIDKDSNGNFTYSTIESYMGVSYIQYDYATIGGSSGTYFIDLEDSASFSQSDIIAAAALGKQILGKVTVQEGGFDRTYYYYPSMPIVINGNLSASIFILLDPYQWENYGSPSSCPVRFRYQVSSNGIDKFDTQYDVPGLPTPSYFQNATQTLIVTRDAYQGPAKYTWEYNCKGMPCCPINTDGTFTLKATITDGAVTYAWVQDTL